MKKCNAKCEVYSRVTGYFRPVTNWNKGKQQEFKDRKPFKVTGAAVALLAVLFLLFALVPVRDGPEVAGHAGIHFTLGIAFSHDSVLLLFVDFFPIFQKHI